MQKLIIFLFPILLLTTGCATCTKSRANDLADCFTARVGLGPGLGVRAQVTNYLGASVGGTREDWKVGYFGRRPIGIQEGFWVGPPVPQIVSCIFTGILFFGDFDKWGGPPSLILLEGFLSTNVKDTDSVPRSFCVLGLNIAEVTDAGMWLSAAKDKSYDPFIREKFFIEFGAALGIVSFDAGFNPVEFVDFLLGWIGLDITGDDAQETPKP